MKVTYQADEYSIDRINTEHMGFIDGGEAWSFVYEQRDRKGVMIKAWQVWLDNVYDLGEWLSDLAEPIEKAIKAIGTENWMVRV